MGTSNLKTAQITALDTYQPVGDVQNAGSGADARLTSVSGTVTPVAADAAGSTYRLARIPSDAVVKHVWLASQAQGAGAIQLGVYYSDSAIDGTNAANKGLVVPTTGVNFFAQDVSLATAVPQTDETFQNQATAGAYNPSLINQQLWQALGLTSDPGGCFDIVATVHTTAITTGGGFLSLQVDYAE
jgi:hypothetical protein